MRNRVRLILTGLAVLIVAGALLIPLPNDWKATWRHKFLDLGHVPLFALLTLWLVRVWPGGRWRAVAAATVLAGVCELGQAWVGRGAGFLDFLRGALGSRLAAACLRAFDRPLRLRRLAGHLVLAIALAAWPVADALPALLDAITAYRSFPLLGDFQTPWEAERWYTEQVTVERIPDPDEPDRWVGRMEFLPAANVSSGVVLFPVVRDWTGYRRLWAEFSFTGEPLLLLISVRDGRKVSPPLKRFDLERRFAAGGHRVSIDLEELARGGEFAPLDLARVESFHLVVKDLDRPRLIFVHRIYLE